MSRLPLLLLALVALVGNGTFVVRALRLRWDRPARRRPSRPLRHLPAIAVPLVVVTVAGLFVAGPLGTPACAAEGPAPGRVDLRLLLVTDGPNQNIDAWKDLLQDEGVPYDVIDLAAGGTVDAAALERGRYQGIVLGDARLSPDSRPDLPTALGDDARAALDAYQRATGARVVDATVVPDASLPVAVATGIENLDGMVGTLTAAGRAVFPYLRSEVPVEAAFGYVPDGPLPAGVTPLVSLPDGRPIVFTFRRIDGTEVLAVGPQVSVPVLHWRLLRDGLLSWLTRGVHLGLRTFHFAVEVDDVFLPNFRWDPRVKQTRAAAGQSRMTAADAAFADAWTRANGLRLDMTFNAAGRTKTVCDALLSTKGDFGWLNHTYAHRNLDTLSANDIVEEISRNDQWAAGQHLPGYRPDSLVTGAHTGLQNPALAGALERAGVRWVASDASRESQQRRIGPALTVPRFPTGIFYDASTRAEQLDEYNHVYFDACDPSVNRCRTAPATWEDFVTSEAEIMFRHVIDGDPRVHYVHQSNLTDDRTLYPVLERMLARYHRYIDAPIVQPTLSESGEELRLEAQWASALRDGRVEAWVEGGRVVVRSSVDVEVPVTGVTGAVSAGTRQAWVKVRAGTAHTIGP